MRRADDAGLADAAADWTAAYVHVPFCTARCPYCDFAIVVGTEGMERYFRALSAEIEASAPFRPLDAVFFGGGTPSLAEQHHLVATLERLRRRFGLAAGAEVSLEANPEDWSASMAADLVAAGFTRVSFGVQSFEPQVLAGLGRRHTPEQAETAVRVARRAGFESVSVDVIFGDPRETAAGWAATVQRAIRAGADHISTYALTVEPGTELFRQVSSGLPGPDDDTQADRYEEAGRLLSQAGFVRYEVSNHARVGHACRYNLIVWACGEYLGFGMAAHGFKAGRRTRNARRFGDYVERVEASGSAVTAEESLEPAEAARERLFVGLRRAAGVAFDETARSFVGTNEGVRLIDAGLLEVAEGRLRVVDPLLTDEVARAVLA